MTINIPNLDTALAALNAQPELEEGTAVEQTYEAAPVDLLDLIAQLDPKAFKFEEILGVPVAYKPAKPKYVLAFDEKADRMRYLPQIPLPVHVTHAMAGRWDQFFVSCAREAMFDMTDQAAFEVYGRRCRLLGSAQIPPLCCYIDKDGFYRNELEAAEEAQDFDGDAGAHTDPVYMHAHSIYRPNPNDKMHKYHGVERPAGKYVIWVKMPKTFRSLPLFVLDHKPAEVFEVLPSLAQIHGEAEPIDIDKQALKSLEANDTGIRTFKWMIRELLAGHKLGSTGARMAVLFADVMRFVDIELRGLKGRSKDSMNKEETEILESLQALEHRFGWFFSSNRIGKMRRNQVKWFFRENLQEIMVRLGRLDVAFRDIEPAESNDEGISPICDRNLLRRLLDLGLLGYQELDDWTGTNRAGEKLPPACMVWLKRPGVAFCGLTDIKRTTFGDDKFLTFAYIIPPVAIRVKGRVTVVHPLVALANRLAEFNTDIVSYDTGELIGQFPRTVDDLARFGGKRAGLQKWIQELVGIYGDACPSRMTAQGLVPSIMAKRISQRCVCADFGETCVDPIEKLAFLKELDAIVPTAYAGGKGNNSRIRKYPLAKANGVAIWADETSHPRRSANQRAQLLRAQVCERKFVTAIVDMTTNSQVYITPSGIENQKAKTSLFLPRVSNEPVEGTDRNGNDYAWVAQDHFSWSGDKVRCWIGDARETVEIGKLLDFEGMKFVPARAEQAYYVDREANIVNVDLIVPYQEIQAKACTQAWLKGAVKHTIIINSQSVEAWIVERDLYRSGAASENITPTRKPMRIKGVDAIGVLTEIAQLHPELLVEGEDGIPVGLPRIDTTYAEAIQAAALAIKDRLPEEVFEAIGWCPGTEDVVIRK